MELIFETWPIDRCVDYARNPRKNDHAVDKVAAAIREFGFRVPIVAKSDGLVVDGHLRLKAAKKLGLTEVPVILADDMTEAQIKAFRLSVNKVAELAEWDDALLGLEIMDLKEMGFDLELTGFDLTEIDALFPVEETAGLTDEDAVPEAPEQPVTVEGDVWLLGRHRLMCGDSTSIDAVDKLMAGRAVDLIFTDPPYNVAFNGRSGKHEVIKNDDLSASDFKNFIGEVCSVIAAQRAKAVYVWCNWKFYGELQGRLPYKACIVWAKNVFGLGRGYRHQHEFCLFDGAVDDAIKNESDLWEVKKDTAYVHPTQKPVALSVRAFGNHIKLTSVLDLFGGSGSTLIGAEQTGRDAHVMELDPKYCDVIIKRWQDFTGQQATLEATGQTYDELKAEREAA
jgi:DNA modification methylase